MKLITTIINEHHNPKQLSELFQYLDLELITQRANKTKFEECMFLAEFPDVTIINIPHWFSKTNNYVNVETTMLINQLVTELNKQLKKYKLKVFIGRSSNEDAVTKLIAQPLDYTLAEL